MINYKSIYASFALFFHISFKKCSTVLLFDLQVLRLKGLSINCFAYILGTLDEFIVQNVVNHVSIVHSLGLIKRFWGRLILLLLRTEYRFLDIFRSFFLKVKTDITRLNTKIDLRTSNTKYNLPSNDCPSLRL